MITYNDIYEALRKEKYSEQLQPITKKFVKETSEYFEEKKQTLMKEDQFSEVVTKSKKQLENAISMFKELMLRRKKKILNLVFIAAETGIAKRDFENMLSFEKNLFDRIIEEINISDRELNQTMKGESITEITSKNTLVVFKENVEEFLDLEGKKTGPFEKGEIASLNSDIAKILVTSNRADYVEGKKED